MMMVLVVVAVAAMLGTVQWLVHRLFSIIQIAIELNSQCSHKLLQRA